MSKDVRTLSSRLVQISENVILLVIGLATLFASGVEVKRLFDTGMVNLSDLFCCLSTRKCWEWSVPSTRAIEFPSPFQSSLV